MKQVAGIRCITLLHPQIMLMWISFDSSDSWEPSDGSVTHLS